MQKVMRAVIYARYSSENQRDASIDDQIEVCRRYIERQGWTAGDDLFRPGDLAAPRSIAPATSR